MKISSNDELHAKGEANNDNEHTYTNHQIYKCFGHDEAHDEGEADNDGVADAAHLRG